MAEDWLEKLKNHVQQNRLVVFQFEGWEWSRLQESRRGANQFTFARPHELFEKVRFPTACLVLCRDTNGTTVNFGLACSRRAVTTLESRIKVNRALRIRPSSKSEILQLVKNKPHSGKLLRRLTSQEPVIALSPNLSVHLIEILAVLESNHGPMRNVISSLSAPKYYRGMEAMQEDAVQMALRAFGLSHDDLAISLELARGKGTVLSRVNVVEDSVVEHDARNVPQYDMISSDFTGRAVFQKNHERLVVFTANRRPLEKVFGVDLIYLNSTRNNIVMVQYKMLEANNPIDGNADWIYRPDSSLESEIGRMRKFNKTHPPGQFEYRLNPQVFYLKFVKRNSALSKASIILPVDHFERLRTDPSCKGPRGAFRISYNSLAGRYLRQDPFLELIRAGYIGANAETTSYLKNLVQAVVDGDRTVVTAIQSVLQDNVV